MNNIVEPTKPRAGFTGCLAGKPFSAVFSLSGASDHEPNHIAVSRMVRDNLGSTRTDAAGNQYSWILDCAKQRTIFLDHLRRLAIVIPIALQDSSSTIGFKKYPRPTHETATILNITCQKILLFEDKAATRNIGEVWIAEELAVVLRDVESSDAGSSKWEMVSIKFAEPSKSSFEIPSNYQQLPTRP